MSIRPKIETRLTRPWPWMGIGVLLTSIWLSCDPNGLAWNEFPLDDCWIHLVYIRSIATIGWPEYNPGQAETGMSSLLWVLINVPFYVVGQGLKLSPAIFPKLLSGCFGGLCAWRLYTLNPAFTKPWSLLPSILLLLHPHWLFSSASGMEVTLTAFLWLQAIHHREQKWGALWLGFALLCRLESLLLWGIILLNGRIKKHRLDLFYGQLAIPLVFLLTWLSYNYSVSTHMLPATFAVKGQTESFIRLSNIQNFMRYFWVHIGPVGLFALAFGLFQLSVQKKDWIWSFYLLALVSVMSITHTMAQAEYFYWSRYLHPILPIFILISGKVLHTSYKRILWLWLGWNLFTMIPVHTQFMRNIDDIHHIDTQVGRWLSEWDSNAWIASTNAGSVRFHSNRPVIDIIGLNTHELAYAENSSQQLINLFTDKSPTHFLLFASPDSGRLVEALSLELVQVVQRPNLSLCDCPPQQNLGIFQPKTTK